MSQWESVLLQDLVLGDLFTYTTYAKANDCARHCGLYMVISTDPEFHSWDFRIARIYDWAPHHLVFRWRHHAE